MVAANSQWLVPTICCTCNGNNPTIPADAAGSNAENEVQAGENLCFSASETKESLPLLIVKSF
jgi:hypothetical protein